MIYIYAVNDILILNVELLDLKWERFDEDLKKQWAGTFIIHSMKIQSSKKPLTTEEIALVSKNGAIIPQGSKTEDV